MKTVTVTKYRYDSAGRLRETVATEEILFPDGEERPDEDPSFRHYSPNHPVFHKPGKKPKKRDNKVVNLDDYR